MIHCIPGLWLRLIRATLTIQHTVIPAITKIHANTNSNKGEQGMLTSSVSSLIRLLGTLSLITRKKSLK